MLCAFVVLRSRFAFHKAVVLECTFAYVILVLCHTTEVFGNAEWPAVQPGCSVHLVYPLLSAGLVIHVACHVHSMLWSGLSQNKVSTWTSLLCLTLWSVYMNQIRELMSVNFLSDTQCPRLSSGCCMPLSKCWLLSAKLGVPTVCIRGSYWSLGLKGKAKLDSKRVPCYNREHSL